jgi:competence protein ComEA
MKQLGRAPWRGYVALSLFWLTVLAGVLLFVRRPVPQPIEILPPPTLVSTATLLSTPAPTATSTPQPLRVDVIGAVVNPHVCTLPAGSIVADAILAAGGPTEDADLDRVNKAIALQDGMQIYVPRVLDTSVTPVGIYVQSTVVPVVRVAPVLELPGLVNLNFASTDELESLPGIGPKIAQQIVDDRPYAKVEDLLRVKGIGPATLAKIQDLVTVE